MMMVVLEKEVLVRAVTGERDGSDSKAREDALEAIETGEGAGVPPYFTGIC